MRTLSTQPPIHPTPAERVAGLRSGLAAAQAARDVNAERSARRAIDAYAGVLREALNKNFAAFRALRGRMDRALLDEAWRQEQPYVVPFAAAYDECQDLLGTFNLAWPSRPGEWTKLEDVLGGEELAKSLYGSIQLVEQDYTPRSFALFEDGVEIARLDRRPGMQEFWTLTSKRNGDRKSWPFNGVLRGAILDVVLKLGLE